MPMPDEDGGCLPAHERVVSVTPFLRHARLVVLVLGWVGGAGIAAQQPVFRGIGDAVRLFVTVADRDGRLVTTLGREAFEVRDDGRPQPITLFDNTPQAIR